MRLLWRSYTVSDAMVRFRNLCSSTIAPSGFDWDMSTLGVFSVLCGFVWRKMNKEKRYGTFTYCMG